MLRRYIAVLMFLVVLSFASRARADIVFVTEMSNLAENPDATPLLTSTLEPRPTSFGSATFILNDAHTALSFTATVFNIDFTGTQTADTNDNLTAAHIHAGPNATPEGTGSVVWGFIGAPFNDNNPNDVLVTPFTSGVGGTVSGKWDLPEGNNTTLAAQLPNIFLGRSYINFHTVQFPTGEVRGNIRLASTTNSAVHGSGSLGDSRGNVRANFSAFSNRQRLAGNVQFIDRFNDIRLRARQITAVQVSGNMGIISGVGTVNGVQDITFTLIVNDNTGPFNTTGDGFSLLISNGYSIGTFFDRGGARVSGGGPIIPPIM
jgi:hypothetical protein